MKFNPDCIIRQMQDSCFILIKINRRSTVKEIYSVNQSGAMIIHALTEGKTNYEIISLLEKTYGIDYRQGLKDLSDFLHILKLKKIITEE